MMNKRLLNLFIISLHLSLIMAAVYKDTKDRNIGMFLQIIC